MKYAICNETFQDWPFERACAFSRQCGYQGIELAPFTFAPLVQQITAEARAEIVRTAARHELEVLGIHWLLAKTEGFHLTTTDKEARKRTTSYFGELARFCRDVGGSIMVLGSPQQRNVPEGVSLREATANAREVIEGFLPELERQRVVLAIEPLGPSEGNFLLTAAEAVALIRQINSPWVRLHLDCKAMSSETASIPELLMEHQRELVHFHANDPNRQGPGFGELDFEPILAALKKINYSGWISVEVFDYSAGIETIASRSIECLTRCEKLGDR